MSQVEISRDIAAPVDKVFAVVGDADRFSTVVPEIAKVEFLSEQRRGVGARFRETRVVAGREVVTELETTEYVENQRVRLVAESHGVTWDSLFTLEPSDGQATRLTLTMNTRSQTIAAKLIAPLVMGFVKTALTNDMDAVKAFCEGP